MIFIGLQERTSGLIRGVQLAKKFGWKFYEQGDQRVLQERNETIIFIRSINLGLAKILRDLGNKVGFDLLDRPVADQHQLLSKELDWKIYQFDIDFYIVNNTLTKEFLENQGKVSKPIYVIPHHTVNFESRKIRFNESVKNVGYIGLENQFSNKEIISKYLKDRNINFIMHHPNTREEVVDVMSTFDIGIVSVDDDNSLWKKYIFGFKPNVKLSNFQSFGIPTIASPYSSFCEFGENQWLKANSIDEFIHNLDFLISDVKTRSELSRSSLVVGEKFHISNMYDYYGAIK